MSPGCLPLGQPGLATFLNGMARSPTGGGGGPLGQAAEHVAVAIRTVPSSWVSARDAGWTAWVPWLIEGGDQKDRSPNRPTTTGSSSTSRNEESGMRICQRVPATATFDSRTRAR